MNGKGQEINLWSKFQNLESRQKLFHSSSSFQLQAFHIFLSLPQQSSNDLLMVEDNQKENLTFNVKSFGSGGAIPTAESLEEFQINFMLRSYEYVDSTKRNSLPYSCATEVMFML